MYIYSKIERGKCYMLHIFSWPGMSLSCKWFGLILLQQKCVFKSSGSIHAIPSVPRWNHESVWFPGTFVSWLYQSLSLGCCRLFLVMSRHGISIQKPPQRNKEKLTVKNPAAGSFHLSLSLSSSLRSSSSAYLATTAISDIALDPLYYLLVFLLT